MTRSFPSVCNILHYIVIWREWERSGEVGRHRSDGVFSVRAPAMRDLLCSATLNTAALLEIQLHNVLLSVEFEFVLCVPELEQRVVALLVQTSVLTAVACCAHCLLARGTRCYADSRLGAWRSLDKTRTMPCRHHHRTTIARGSSGRQRLLHRVLGSVLWQRHRTFRPDCKRRRRWGLAWRVAPARSGEHPRARHPHLPFLSLRPTVTPSQERSGSGLLTHILSHGILCL
jgi:hypothetical protein